MEQPKMLFVKRKKMNRQRENDGDEKKGAFFAYLKCSTEAAGD